MFYKIYFFLECEISAEHVDPITAFFFQGQHQPRSMELR